MTTDLSITQKIMRALRGGAMTTSALARALGLSTQAIRTPLRRLVRYQSIACEEIPRHCRTSAWATVQYRLASHPPTVWPAPVAQPDADPGAPWLHPIRRAALEGRRLPLRTTTWHWADDPTTRPTRGAA